MNKHAKLVLGAAAIALAACASEGSTVGCENDDECPNGQSCEDGVCKCDTSDQCAVGEYCNSFRACQERPACVGNQDCDDGFICNSADRTGGKCIPELQCGTSVHCELNNFCRIEQGNETGICTPGCRNTGDCQLGHVCIAGTCSPGSSCRLICASIAASSMSISPMPICPRCMPNCWNGTMAPRACC